MNDPADAIAKLSQRLSDLDDKQYSAHSALSKLQKELADLQIVQTELDKECIAELGSIAECEEQLSLAVKECQELENKAVNSKLEASRRQAWFCGQATQFGTAANGYPTNTVHSCRSDTETFAASPEARFSAS